MENPADESSPVVSGDGKSKEDHNAGMWLVLKRFDSIVKYLEFATLVIVLVFDRLGTMSWYEGKYFWWILGSTLSLNFLMQSFHIFLYYVANRFAKDKYYWPPVFPAEWIPNDHGTGFSQHYKFFYVLKAGSLAYMGWMIFQEKLDEFFMYPILFITFLLIVFDLCYYLFGLY